MGLPQMWQFGFDRAMVARKRFARPLSRFGLLIDHLVSITACLMFAGYQFRAAVGAGVRVGHRFRSSWIA